MFESSLLNKLSADSDLISLLSTFSGQPAIFSDFAPQEAEERYIVFDIQVEPRADLEVDSFTINFDIYDTAPSNENIRNIAERLVFLLEPGSIENDPRYRTIRFYQGSAGFIKSNETEIKHYNIQFYARGTRKKWIDQL